MNYKFADAEELMTRAAVALRPPPKLMVSEWAEEYRRLSVESSASPGKFSLDMTPYFREPMEMVGRSDVRSIALMTSAQVGKSTFIENIIGYFIHLDPCPILHISPTLDSMKMFSKERLAPMIRDTPVLTDLVREARTRDSGNTIASKTFPGGHIAMVGSNSPAGLASRPIRILVADEVDRFESSAGTEGDPLKLGIKRTTTYWNRILAFVSTPGDKYDPKEQTGSRIEKEFIDGDQRHYHVKCPHCDHEQKLKWSQVKWEDRNASTAYYVCIENGCVWDDSDRWRAIDNGVWIAERPFNGRVSYHLSQLYSKFTTLSEGVSDFLDSRKDPMMMKTWINTYLGESWEDKGERVNWSDLKDQMEDYNISDDIPEDITIITCAVDIQDTWFEIEFIGWGDDNKSWSLGHSTINGDPSAPDIWDDLDKLLDTIFIHPVFGEMTARAIAVDSGGHYTQGVYNFCEHRPRTVAIKGIPGKAKPFVGGKLKNTLGGATVYGIGVDTIKETVVARLGQGDPESDGYCRFPAHYKDAYFESLTAEQKVTKFRKGYKITEWTKIRSRNEVFDLRVYNTAALHMTSMNNLRSERLRMLRELKKHDNSVKKKKKKTPPRKDWVNDWKN